MSDFIYELSKIQTIQDAIRFIPWWGYLQFVIICLLVFRVRLTPHAIMVRFARRRLKQLKTIQNPGQQYSYLRKVNHFVYEEMILTALYCLGYQIKRNKRYTGDGGIDGRVYINKKLVLIQAKRYKDHIKLQDVKDFAAVCTRKKCKGLFVHTGRTGKGVWADESVYSTIDVVSGERMLKLLTGDGFTPRITV